MLPVATNLSFPGTDASKMVAVATGDPTSVGAQPAMRILQSSTRAAVASKRAGLIACMVWTAVLRALTVTDLLTSLPAPLVTSSVYFVVRLTVVAGVVSTPEVSVRAVPPPPQFRGGAVLPPALSKVQPASSIMETEPPLVVKEPLNVVVPPLASTGVLVTKLAISGAE